LRAVVVKSLANSGWFTGTVVVIPDEGSLLIVENVVWTGGNLTPFAEGLPFCWSRF